MHHGQVLVGARATLVAIAADPAFQKLCEQK
jgi:hypothetical protein